MEHEKSNPQKIIFPKQGDKQKTIYIGDDADLHEAAEHLRDTYKRKSQARFDLIFRAIKEYNRCKKSCHAASFYDFIKKLLFREENLPWQFNSFKQGYAIVEAFPDLKWRSKRKLLYSHYRAIANADLDKQEKYIVRKTFERKIDKRKKVTIADIKRELKNRYEIGTYLEQYKVITYCTKRQFLEQVGDMVSDYKEIRNGSRVDVRLKLVRQTKDQKVKAKKKTPPPRDTSTFSIHIKESVQPNPPL